MPWGPDDEDHSVTADVPEVPYALDIESVQALLWGLVAAGIGIPSPGPVDGIIGPRTRASAEAAVAYLADTYPEILDDFDPRDPTRGTWIARAILTAYPADPQNWRQHIRDAIEVYGKHEAAPATPPAGVSKPKLAPAAAGAASTGAAGKGSAGPIILGALAIGIAIYLLTRRQ